MKTRKSERCPHRVHISLVCIIVHYEYSWGTLLSWHKAEMQRVMVYMYFCSCSGYINSSRSCTISGGAFLCHEQWFLIHSHVGRDIPMKWI